MKVGIIGSGRISSYHLRAYQSIKDLEIIGVFSVDKKELKEFCSKHNLTEYSSLDQLITDSDILSVCTPTNTHVQLAKQVLDQDRFCLLEKPLCLLPENAKNITDHQNLNKLNIIFQNRYNQAVKVAKKAIESEKIGKVIQVSANMFWYRGLEYYTNSPWHGKKALEGGIIYNQGIHTLDAALFLMGAKAQNTNVLYSYKKLMRDYPIETEDYFLTHLTYNNIPISFEINTAFYNKNYENSIVITGTKGAIKLCGVALEDLDYFSPDQNKVFHEQNDDIYGEGHYDNIKDFVQKIKTGQGSEYLCDFEQAYQLAGLLQRIYRKANS